MESIKTLLISCVALVLLPFSSKLSAQSIKRLDGSSIRFDQLDHTIKELMNTAKVTGLSVAVFNKNKPVYIKSYGYTDISTQKKMDTATIYWSCSLSKAMFAYTVLKMADKGIINLDTPLVQYLKKPLYEYAFTKKTRGYQDIKEDKRYEKITARMCLNHTTGLPNYRGFETDGKLRIKYDPGTRFSYSGEGMYLLQFVLEQITGKDFETIAQEEAFHPLIMKNSSYVWHEAFDKNYCVGHDSLQKPYEFDKRTSPHSAGSMYTTINDFSTFFTALLQKKGLSKKSNHEMFSPQVPILSKQQFGPNALVDDKTISNTKIFYGLGVGILKTPYGNAFFKEGHSEGWGHYAIGFPDKGIGIIIMTNSDNGEGIYKSLMEKAIGNIYTPWYWENYTPFNQKQNSKTK
ncbi:beta-lactamase family protein [Elizabethkingia ursingii]|uniref:serine hydrolase domain-containing protein n=1 Tax=Elizabethkingia ursingii TaxID=1756150 RepID=UPI0020120A46|nr:serine hydrolase domain-containing protein [Elizabethkingia ursingii]MCL1670057.1 beta-lactamase family protein [Elizabethkingia ursingii]